MPTYIHDTWAWSPIITASSTTISITNNAWVWDQTPITYATTNTIIFTNNNIASGPTPEEERRWREAQAKIKEKLDLAAKVAEELLLSFLSADQAKSWRENKTVRVIAQSGKEYTIDGKKKQHNILEMFGERPIRELCVYVGDDVPLADNVLGQMLHLMYNEAHLRERANIWELARIGDPVPIARALEPADEGVVEAVLAPRSVQQIAA